MSIKLLTTDGGVPTGGTTDRAPAIIAYILSNPWGADAEKRLALEGFYNLNQRLFLDATLPAGVTIEPATGFTVDTCGFERKELFHKSEVAGALKQSHADTIINIKTPNGVWTLKNFTIRTVGLITVPKYNPLLEAQQGITLEEAHNVVLDGLKFLAIGSDFVTISGNASPSRNVTLRNLYGSIACRQLISPTFADVALIEDCVFQRSGRSGCDFEPLTSLGWSAKNVTFRRTTIEAIENTAWGGGPPLRVNVRLEQCTCRGGTDYIALGSTQGLDDGVTIQGKNNGTFDYHYLGNAVLRLLVGTALVERTEQAWAGTPTWPLFAGAGQWTYLGFVKLPDDFEFVIATPGSGLGTITWQEVIAGVWTTINVESDASAGFTLAGTRRVNVAISNNATPWSVPGAPGDYLGQADVYVRWNGSAWVTRNDTGEVFQKTAAASFEDAPVTIFDGTDDVYYIGQDVPFEGLKWYLDTLGVGVGTITAEYSRGAGVWGALAITDNTTGLSINKQTMTWSTPGDWAKDIPIHSGVTIPGGTPGNPSTTSYYYVRLKCSGTPSTLPKMHLLVLKDTKLYWIRVQASALGASPLIQSVRSGKKAGGTVSIKNAQNILVENVRAFFNNTPSSAGVIGQHVSPAGDGVSLPGVVQNNIFTNDRGDPIIATVGPEIFSTGNIGIPNQGGGPPGLIITPAAAKLGMQTLNPAPNNTMMPVPAKLGLKTLGPVVAVDTHTFVPAPAQFGLRALIAGISLPPLTVRPFAASVGLKTLGPTLGAIAPSVAPWRKLSAENPGWDKEIPAATAPVPIPVNVLGGPAMLGLKTLTPAGGGVLIGPNIDLYVTSWTGDGSPRTITTPWDADVAIVRRRDLAAAVAMVWRLRSWGAGSAKTMFLQEAFYYDGMITAFPVNGITLGTDPQVNASGATYDLVALRTGAALSVVSWVGDGAAGGQVVPLTFAPVMVWAVTDAGAGIVRQAVMRCNLMATQESRHLHDSTGGTPADAGLHSTGGNSFRALGLGLGINGFGYNVAGTTYHAVAFGPAANASLVQYTGTSTDGRLLSIPPITGVPDWVYLQNVESGSADKGGVARISGYDTTDIAGQVISGNVSKADFLQQLLAGQVELGTKGNVAGLNHLYALRIAPYGT